LKIGLVLGPYLT